MEILVEQVFRNKIHHIIILKYIVKIKLGIRVQNYNVRLMRVSVYLKNQNLIKFIIKGISYYNLLSY